MRYRLFKEMPSDVVVDIIRGGFSSSHTAYVWARDIGDRDVLRERCHCWEEHWSRDIGDIEYMRKYLINKGVIYLIYNWNATYKGTKYAIPTP